VGDASQPATAGVAATHCGHQPAQTSRVCLSIPIRRSWSQIADQPRCRVIRYNPGIGSPSALLDRQSDPQDHPAGIKRHTLAALIALAIAYLYATPVSAAPASFK